MKKYLSTIKNCFALLILCIFPFCIALIVEFAIHGSTEIVSNKLIALLTLLGAITSMYVFSKEGVTKIKIKTPSKIIMLGCMGLGASLKPLVLCILHFLSSLNITNSGNMYLWSLVSSVIITSIAEEIIFRGLLTDILGVCNAQSKLGIISGIFLTAIVWALSHLHGINIPTLLLIFDGIIIGLIYYYYKNLIYCILYHCANNITIILMSNININWKQFAVLSFFAIIASIIMLSYNCKKNKMEEG